MARQDGFRVKEGQQKGSEQVDMGGDGNAQQDTVIVDSVNPCSEVEEPHLRVLGGDGETDLSIFDLLEVAIDEILNHETAGLFALQAAIRYYRQLDQMPQRLQDKIDFSPSVTLLRFSEIMMLGIVVTVVS